MRVNLRVETMTLVLANLLRKFNAKQAFLEEIIVNCWSDISQQFIDKAVDQWSRRIAAIVAARGRHIEYSFD